MTWVPQNRQGKLHSHSGGAPHPLRSAGKHSTKVNRTFGPARPDYTAPSCPTEQLSWRKKKKKWYFTNYATCPWVSLFCPWLSLVCPWLSPVRPCLSLVSPRMSLVCLNHPLYLVSSVPCPSFSFFNLSANKFLLVYDSSCFRIQSLHNKSQKCEEKAYLTLKSLDYFMGNIQVFNNLTKEK